MTDFTDSVYLMVYAIILLFSMFVFSKIKNKKLNKIINNFQDCWNSRIRYKGYNVFVKESYSSSAPRLLVCKVKSKEDAYIKVKELQNKHKGVLFFYEPF